MKASIVRLALILIAAASLMTSVACAADPIPGIGPVGPVRRVATNLGFTEGPASDGKGNVYFSDIPANRIYRVDAAGTLSVAVEPSNHANGLMFASDGRLFATEMDGALVLLNLVSGERTVLTGQYNGARYNAPNDLVIDGHGGVYFSDPRFRAPDPLPQGTEAFYYRSADGEVTRLGADLPAPNGVILSPDEQTLYVIPSLQKEMMAYPVTGPGKLGKGRVFCTLQQPAGADNSGGDGVTIDTRGNLYIASQLGIQVFSPEGHLLGILEFPEQPSNATFAGERNRTLYVTARTSVYTVEMEAQGHVFPGQSE